MLAIKSYVGGAWFREGDEGAALVNPATEEVLASASTAGLDFGAALAFARGTGGPALRALSFAERGAMLEAMSKAIHAHREELIEASIRNGGNTRSDAKFDIDGAWSTLGHYAELGKELGDRRVILDGDSRQLGRNPRYHGQHLWTPRRGAAVHINAYNFPAWGLAEKAAAALLAGMPVVSKPATSTALLAFRIMEVLVESGALPPGAFSFIGGGAGDLLDHLGAQDVLSFTGSGATAARLRGHGQVIAKSVRVNVEADSLNAAVLGPDVERGSETWSMALREAATDVRQKAGQKCTAIRRVFVPASLLEDAAAALAEELSSLALGNPAESSVRVGPLVSAAQLADVREGLAALGGEATRVIGDPAPSGLVGVADGVGYFVSPHVFRCEDSKAASLVHDREVFGPAVTVLPYADAADAAAQVARGEGGLVSSVYTDDRKFARELLLELAPFHGRLTLGNAKVAEHSPGPGTVLPQSVHGGPGRAGGGEELGGLRGLSFYQQRTAVQGYRPLLEKFFKEA